MNNQAITWEDYLDRLDDIEQWLDLRSPYSICQAFQAVKELYSSVGEVSKKGKPDIEQSDLSMGDKLKKRLKELEDEIKESIDLFWRALLFSKLKRIEWLNTDYLDGNAKIGNKSSNNLEAEVENVTANLHCFTKTECLERPLDKAGEGKDQKNKVQGENKESLLKKCLIYSELAILYATPGIDRYDLSLGYAKNALQIAKEVKSELRKRLERIALYSQGLAFHHLHDEIEALKVLASKELDFRSYSMKSDSISEEDARKLYLQIFAQIQRADALIHLQRCYEALWLLSKASNKTEGTGDLFLPHPVIIKLAEVENNQYHHVLTLVYIKLAEASLDMRLFEKAEEILGKALNKATNRINNFDPREIDPGALSEIFYHTGRLKLEKAAESLERLELLGDKKETKGLLEEIEKLLTAPKQPERNDVALEEMLRRYGATGLLVKALSFEDDGKYKFKLTPKRRSQIVQKLADVGLTLVMDSGKSELNEVRSRYEQILKEKECQRKLQQHIENFDSQKQLNGVLFQLYLAALDSGGWDDVDSLDGLCQVIKAMLKDLRNGGEDKEKQSNVTFRRIEEKARRTRALEKSRAFTQVTLDLLDKSKLQGDYERWRDYDLREALKEEGSQSLFRRVADNLELKVEKWEKPLVFLIAFLADNLRSNAQRKGKPNTAQNAEALFDEMLSSEPWEKHCEATKEILEKLEQEAKFANKHKSYETLLSRYPRPVDIERRLIENNQDILNLLQGYSVDKSWYSELIVLRRWNSYSPVLSRESRRSRGGGYFLQLRSLSQKDPRTKKQPKSATTGLVVDPGFDFLENFFSEGFAFLDIDAVLLTHAHPDHSEGLIPILNLPFQLEKQLKIKKPLLYLLSPGAYEKYHLILQDSRDQIRDIVRLDPEDFPKRPLDFSHLFEAAEASDSGFTGKKLKLEIVTVKHSDVGGRETLGLKVEIPSSNRNMWFVYSSDTKWSHKIAENLFDNINQKNSVVCLHIGSILDLKPEGKEKAVETLEYFRDEGTLEKAMIKHNHLYLSGVLLMLKHWLKNTARENTDLLGIISEFGEEMRGGLRQVTCEILEDYLLSLTKSDSGASGQPGEKTLRILPADIGLRVELTENPRVFCEKCQAYVKPNCITVKTYGAEESLFFLCDNCKKDVHETCAFMEKACAHGKQFVWDLEKGR